MAARFCCAGCLAVSQTIRTAGLTAFYALRDERAAAGPRPAEDDSTREAEAAAHLVRRIDAEHCEVALLVEGMLLMAWNVARTIAIGKATEAPIPTATGALPAAA